MTGLQLAERLRQLDPNLPILFIAGYASLGTGSQLPGPYLRKPSLKQPWLDVCGSCYKASKATSSAAFCPETPARAPETCSTF